MSRYVMAINLPDDLMLYLKERLVEIGVQVDTAITVSGITSLFKIQKFQLITVVYQEQIYDVEFLATLRRFTFVPIIFILNTFDRNIIRLLLATGADLCLAKDLPPDILFAHIIAQMRRYTDYNHFGKTVGYDTAPFFSGDIFIDPARRIVEVQGHSVNLRPREFSLLLYFMQNPGIVLTSEQICEHAWGMEGSYNQGVSHPVRLLRRAIEPDPEKPVYIETVRRVGYRFTAYHSETCDKC